MRKVFVYGTLHRKSLPKMMERINPRNIIEAWITSVQITAFIPPCAFSIINEKNILSLQYSCILYKLFHTIQPKAKHSILSLDSMLNLARIISPPCTKSSWKYEKQNNPGEDEVWHTVIRMKVQVTKIRIVKENRSSKY